MFETIELIIHIVSYFYVIFAEVLNSLCHADSVMSTETLVVSTFAR